MIKRVCSATVLLIALSLSVVLLGEESSTIYFPDTLDSFWVYEDQDGNEFTRNAVEGEEIGDEVLSAFSYEPELENWVDYCSIFHSSLYKVSDEGVTLVVGDEVEKTLNARLKRETDFLLEFMKSQAPPGAELNIDIKAEAEDGFLLLPDSVAENEEWDSSETSVVLSMQFFDPNMPAPESVSFTFDIKETGNVIDLETVVVPAGTFEDCLKVEYRTETIVSLFPVEANPDDTEPAGETVTTVWLAPNVGIVKYRQEQQHIFLEIIPDNAGFPRPEDPEPITFELKKYEIKTVETDSEASE